MEFFIHKHFNRMHHIQSGPLLQLQSDLIQRKNLIHPKTSFSILNQTLSSLKDDSLKRYPTEINSNSQRNTFPQFIVTPVHHPNFDQVLVPEPWFNVESPFATHSPMTAIRQKQQHFHSLSKSFHLSKNSNSNPRNQAFNQNSASSYNSSANKSLYGKSEKWRQKLNTFLNQENQHYAEKFQTYNYTNQQKARMTLEHLVHIKKHSKMSKILKLKTSSIDNTIDKQQKITKQSKKLIETLQKFSDDQILRKSIDRAIDVLKKRTHALLYNRSKSKKQFRKSCISEFQTNWFSSHKIVGRNQNENKKILVMKRERADEACLISEDMKVDEMRDKKEIENRVKSKVAFKPKRNHLIHGQKMGVNKKVGVEGYDRRKKMEQRKQAPQKLVLSTKKCE